MAEKARRLGGGFLTPTDNLLAYFWFQVHLNRYAFASRFVKDKAVLDVACGVGYGSAYLLDKGVSKIVGGDISDEAIEQAKKYYKKEGVEFVLLDATELPLQDNSFDVIVSMETIEHLTGYERFLSECTRVLKDGGTFICSTPNKEIESPGTEKASGYYHTKEFYISELHDLLNSYFKDLELYGQLFVTGRKRAKFSTGLASIIKNRFSWVPRIEKLINFVARFVFREFRLVKLGEIKDFDSILNKSYQPLPLKANPLSPRVVIATAKVRKAEIE